MKKPYRFLQDLDFSCSDIRSSCVTALYKEEDDGVLGEYVVSICLEAPADEINNTFTYLRSSIACELAYFLCHKTRSYPARKFVIHNKTAAGFDLFRNGFFLRRFVLNRRPLQWEDEPQKVFEGNTDPCVHFQSLLTQHGIGLHNLHTYWIAPSPPPRYWCYFLAWECILTTRIRMRAREFTINYHLSLSA